MLEIAVKLLRSIVQFRCQVVDAIQTFALLDSKAAQNDQFENKIQKEYLILNHNQTDQKCLPT